jgi:hypothetical protein
MLEFRGMVENSEGRSRNVAERIRVSSGTFWEGRVGYSRAVRAGNLVFV